MEITRTMQIKLEVDRQDLLDDLFNEMSLTDIYETWTSEAEKEELKEYLNEKID